MSKHAIANVSTAGGGKRRNSKRVPPVAPALTIVAHPNPQRAGQRCLLDALADGKEVALSRNFAKPGGAHGSARRSSPARRAAV